MAWLKEDRGFPSINIYNGQETPDIVCEGKKISEKSEDGLFCSILAFYHLSNFIASE
jgi:hypothetical protein